MIETAAASGRATRGERPHRIRWRRCSSHWHSGEASHIRSRTYVYAAGWETPSPFTGVHARLGRDPAWTTYALDGGHNLMRDDPEGLLRILRGTIEAR
jgi:hypothetical protein